MTDDEAQPRRRSPRPRRATTLAVAAGAILAAPAMLVAASPSTPSDSAVPARAAVIAQGVIQVGTGDHVWSVAARSVDQQRLNLAAEGPTFVVSTTGPVHLRHGSGESLGMYLRPGEAGYVASGHDYSMEAPGPVQVVELGVRGGQVPDSFALTEGLYDLDLASAVLEPGETLPVSGAVAALVVVSTGAVGLQTGEQLPSGYHLPFEGDFTLTGAPGGPTVVLVALLSSLHPTTVAGAPLSVPAAGPGDHDDPDEEATPGAPTPGAPTPGAPTPGEPTPGESAPGPSAPAPTTAAPTTAPPTTAAPTTAAPTTNPTAISFHLDHCQGGTVRVHASAGGGRADQRNIRRVTISRENEYGNYSSGTQMNWIGYDTAQHHEWSARNINMQRQGLREGIRWVVETRDGRSQTYYGTVSGQTCTLN